MKCVTDNFMKILEKYIIPKIFKKFKVPKISKYRNIKNRIINKLIIKSWIVLNEGKEISKLYFFQEIKLDIEKENIGEKIF